MEKNLFYTLCLVALSIIFTGCSKDGDEPNVFFDNSKVIGSWTITSIEGTSEWYWISNGNTLFFNSDGSCSTGFSMENSWKIENGRVCTYYKKTSEPALIYSLLSAEGSKYRIKVQGTLDESDLSVIIVVKKE